MARKKSDHKMVGACAKKDWKHCGGDCFWQTEIDEEKGFCQAKEGSPPRVIGACAKKDGGEMMRRAFWDVLGCFSVILPSFCIISVILQVIRGGSVPVLVDSDAMFNMDVAQVEAKVSEKTKAIICVHTYHFPVDMEPILALARERGIKVIEDAAEMIGQTCLGRPCGSFGDLSTMSFYPNKHITTGEGGMVLCDDPQLAERCQMLRNLCFDPKRRRFVHEELGWNYRMTNLQATLGLGQLAHLDEAVTRKRQIGRLYNKLLAGCPGLVLPPDVNEKAESNIYWVYGVELLPSVPHDAEEVMKFLAAAKVGTRPFFWPMHEQPVFQEMGLFRGESYPVAERIARRGFYIPSGLALTDEEVEEVAKRVRKVMETLVSARSIVSGQ